MDDVTKTAIGDAAAWARQSFAFAMSIRAKEVGKAVGDTTDPSALFKEAEARTNEFFEDAREKCGDSVPINHVLEIFARTVIEWCHDHLNPSGT